MKWTKSSTSLLTAHTLHVGTALNETQTLHETLHSFWELESLGIKQPDQFMLTEFEVKIKLKNGRYQVSLLWKDVHPPCRTTISLHSNACEAYSIVSYNS